MGLSRATLAGSDVDRMPAVNAKTRADAVALVIGVEEYQGPVPRADYAAADAALMREYLTGVLGFPADRVLLLMNENATKLELAQAVERWLPAKALKDSTVFVYFAGHGTAHSKTRDPYLLPSDGSLKSLGRSGYALKRLYRHLGALPAKEVLVVLDACFGGMGDRSVSAPGKPASGADIADQNVDQGKVVVLMAGRGVQQCHAYREQQHGLLTYFFLKGLRGEGDQNKDGNLLLAEQFEYVKLRVQQVAKQALHTEQVPQLLGNRRVLARGVDLLESAGQ